MKKLLLVFVWLFIAITLMQCIEDAEPKPIVSFNFSFGLNGWVYFENNSIHANKATWSFGDGQTSTEWNPQYQYTSNGNFFVALTVKGSGGSATETLSVIINTVKTNLTFKNNSFTTIDISVNGVPQTITAGSTVTFSGDPGSTAAVYATTSGKTTSGTVIGSVLTWSFNSSYPSTGTSTTDLNVSSTWFFLRIKNTSGCSAQKVYVNYGLTNQTLDNILIPSDGVTYSTGYYKAFTNSNVRIESTS